MISQFFRRHAQVHELDSGELLISHANKKVRFSPDFNLAAAVKIFEKFSERYGDEFYEATEKVDWFPAIQYFLFHKLVFPSILYVEALRYLEENKLIPRFSGGTRFCTLYRIRHRKSIFFNQLLRVVWRIELALTEFHNRWVCRDYGEMFFQYSVDETRLIKLRTELNQHRTGITAIGGGAQVLFKHFFNRNYFLVIPTRYEPLADYEEDCLLLILAKNIISHSRRQMKMYQRIFRQREIGNRFFGIDDTLYLFPLLFALNRSNVQTIGFQHGLYSCYDFGYAVRRCKSFEWYDKLVVWDRFWADAYVKINPYYPKSSVLVGIGAEQFNIEYTPNPQNRHVLCMYERFLDVKEYVYYLRALINAGFHLTIKMRPESTVSDVGSEYGFTTDEMKKIDICDDIDSDLIRHVSFIVGCKTSLLYSLLSVGRPVWIFDTSYHYLEQIMILKNVHIIKKSDINRINELYDQTVNTCTVTQKSDFDLRDALELILTESDAVNIDV